MSSGEKLVTHQRATQNKNYDCSIRKKMLNCNTIVAIFQQFCKSGNAHQDVN